MIYDCGALGKHPNQSSTYRFLTRNRTKTTRLWPEDIAYEAAIFSQSDISYLWMGRVLGLHYFRVQSLLKRFPDAPTMAPMNMASATYDDAYRYMKLGGPKIVPPSWAIPFILEDKKNGMTEVQLHKHWGFTQKIFEDFLKGQADVFHLE